MCVSGFWTSQRERSRSSEALITAQTHEPVWSAALPNDVLGSPGMSSARVALGRYSVLQALNLHPGKSSFLEQSASLFYWGLAAPELYSWCERRNISCNGSDHRASKLTPGSPRLVLKATGSSGKLGALTPRTRFSGGESCFFRGELLANSGGCILSYGRTCRTGMCGRSYMPASL